MDLFEIDPTRAHYSRSGTLNGTHTEITKFSSNDILSSSAWSSVIHQPSQDSEPEDLPSTVDIDAIKEPLTPVNASAPVHVGSDSSDDQNAADSMDSDSDSDSESGNSDNEAENVASGADSASCSDSDSLSSRASSCSSRAKQQSSSSRSKSPISNCGDTRPQFSVQESNFEQGGLKLKLSALKVSKFDSESRDKCPADDAEHSADSSGSNLSPMKRRQKHDTTGKSHRMYSLKMRNENRNKIASAMRHPAEKIAYEREPNSESSSSSDSNLVMRQPSKITESKLAVLNKHKVAESKHFLDVRSSKVGVQLENRKNDIFHSVVNDRCLESMNDIFRRSTRDPVEFRMNDQARSTPSKGASQLPTVKLPQACKLSEDSDDSEDIQARKENSCTAEKSGHHFTMLRNCVSELKVPNKGEVPTAGLSRKKRKAKSAKQKPVASALCDSSSDAEMLSKQVVSDAINRICVDSDSLNSIRDDLPAKMKSTDDDSSSEADEGHEKKLKGQYLSNLLEVFAEKTAQLNKGCAKSEVNFNKVADPANEKRKRGRPPKYKPQAQVDNSIPNVSPDSGIQSNSGSPLYHNLHSLAASQSSMNFKSGGKFSSAAAGSKFLSLSQKTLVSACKKSSATEQMKSPLRDFSIFKESPPSFHNLLPNWKSFKNNGACQAANADDTLRVPPYFGSKVVTDISNLTFFQEKRGPGRPPKKHEFSLKVDDNKTSLKNSCASKGGVSDASSENCKSKKFKHRSPVVLYMGSAKKAKKEKQVASGSSTVGLLKVAGSASGGGSGGPFMPVFGSQKDWLHKHKKRKKKDVKERRRIDVDLLQDIKNLVEVFEKKCVLDNKKPALDTNLHSAISSSRSKIPSRCRERLKKRKVSDKCPEAEANLSSATSSDLKTKRRNKKSTTETPKVQEANCDQRLPLKKRHYHVSTSSSSATASNQTLSETKTARVEKTSSTNEVDDEKVDSSGAEKSLTAIRNGENLKSNKSETSKNMSKGNVTKHTKHETCKSSSTKTGQTEPLGKLKSSRGMLTKMESPKHSTKNEALPKLSTKPEDRKADPAKTSEESKITKSLPVDDAESDGVDSDEVTLDTWVRQHQEKKLTSKQDSTLRRSNRSTSAVNKPTSKSSNVADKHNPKNSKHKDRVDSCERSAKKNAKLNISSSKNKVENQKDKRSSKSKCSKIDDGDFCDAKPNESEIKMKDAPSAVKDVPTLENTKKSTPEMEDSMSLLQPPTLSSAEKEKPRKRVGNVDIDTPPVLDEYTSQSNYSHKEDSSKSPPQAEEMCSNPQLITPLPWESTPEVKLPTLKPPVGVFEPTRQLPPSLTRCKRISIDDMLSKLKEKLKGIESTSEGAAVLMEKISPTSGESNRTAGERMLRPKRSCTEKENINVKKSKMCQDVTVDLPKLVEKQVVNSTPRTKEVQPLPQPVNKEPKPKIKRRKTNRTGFPQLKKKKKVQRYVEASPSVQQSSCESNTVEKEAVSEDPLIPMIKVETPDALELANETGNPEEMCSVLETPPVLTAIHDQDEAESRVNSAGDPRAEKARTKKESDASFGTLPSRCSARISFNQQMRARELKKLQKKGKKKRVARNETSKVDGDGSGKLTVRGKKVESEKSANERLSDGETKIKEEVDRQGDDVSDDSKKDAAPKRRRKFILAGLFSNYYKEDKSAAAEVKNRFISYKPEDHEFGLLPPPPYFEDWVRQRRVDFKLPYDLWWLHTHDRLPGRDIVESWKYKRIRMNVYYDLKPPHVYEAQACNCRVPDDKNKLGCGDDCINRVLYVECSPDLCPLKERCSNQRIRKHNGDVKLCKFMTKDKGIGVKTEKTIKAGEYIVEYVGEVVTDKEFKKRMTSLYKNDIHHYCLSLEGGLVIDSHRIGGDGRFVNHSCEPNCEIEKWNVNGLFRMALFAQRDISPGEELTYDYNFALFNPEEGQPCRCGSTKCRGVIGGKSQRISVASGNGVSNVENAVASTSGGCGAAATVCKKARVRPRKQIRKRPHVLSSATSQQRRRDSEGNHMGETVLPRYSTRCLLPVEPLTADEKEFVLHTRAFLPRNLNRVQRVREKRRQAIENNNESSNNANQNTKCSGKSKSSLEFSQLLNVLSKQRFIKTRGLAQAEDNPEIQRILQLANIFRTIYNFVVSAKEEKDGKPFSSFFMTLPRKEKLSGHCRLIEDPIDLNTIEKNIINGVYKDAETFDEDMKRLIANNIKYYGRTSDQGIAAVRLRKEYNIAKLNYMLQIEEVIGQPIAASFKPVPGDEDEGVIRCICGRSIEEGEMILCDRCLVWQHCSCVEADPNVEQYFCERCVPREVDYEIPLVPDPGDTVCPEKKYYLTLMRDDLQVRLNDTMYLLRDIPNPETKTRHTFRTIGAFEYKDCDIFRVEDLWKTENGERFAFGHHYMRPEETFREHNRRFFPNEVVKTAKLETVPLDLIMGRCYVLDLKTYCKGKPVDADPDHIYICEFRYDGDAKVFHERPKKSTSWLPPSNYAFEKYDTRLKPSRTYAPHGKGDVNPQVKSRPFKMKECDHICNDSAKAENNSTNSKIEEDDVKDSVEEGRKHRLNNILLKLLAKKSTKAPLDASYLLDTGRRNRKKTTSANTT